MLILFVCVEVLRPSQPNGVMSSAVSLPNHTFTGQTQSSKRFTSIVHILSPETDNCPSWISGRERMTVENISWSISTKECCRPRRGLNPRPPGLQSDGASNWATEAGLSVLRFYGPVNLKGSCRVYLTTHLLGRLSPLSNWPVLCTFFRQKQTTVLLESAEGREWQ